MNIEEGDRVEVTETSPYWGWTGTVVDTEYLDDDGGVTVSFAGNHIEIPANFLTVIG